MERFVIVEKADHHAVHGLFYTRERAEHHMNTTIARLCEIGAFMDKTLTIDSFEVIEHRRRRI